VVHRTHKPFHGYVVPNDLNNKFFAQWNASQTPEHLTIAPVMIDDHVIGMLLAIGEKTADTKACLHLAESLANSIASQIKQATKAA
jgi:GAF domain-containing protein